MPKFPEPPPPERLARVPADVRALPAGTRLWRVYFRGGVFPSTWDAWRGFGPSARGRFDHHLLPPRVQERAVYYAAGDLTTCLAEVFQEKRVLNLDRGEPWVVAFDTARPLRLLDLTGRWPTAAGASMAISSGVRARARRWSRAVYGAYPDLDGLWYPSSIHANQPSALLYERARDALPAAPAFHRALADPAIRLPVLNAARRLNYAIARRWADGAREPGPA